MINHFKFQTVLKSSYISTFNPETIYVNGGKLEKGNLMELTY